MEWTGFGRRFRDRRLCPHRLQLTKLCFSNLIVWPNRPDYGFARSGCSLEHDLATQLKHELAGHNVPPGFVERLARVSAHRTDRADRYRSQRNRELEGIGGVSAQFPGAAVSTSTRERETKMLQQRNPLGEECPGLMAGCSATSWHRRRGDLASAGRGSRRCLDR